MDRDIVREFILWHGAHVFILLSSALAAFLTSLGVRLLAESLLTNHVALFGNAVGFLRIENRGIAFGIDLPFVPQMALIIGAFILLSFLAYTLRHNRVQAGGFGLILGGALGNIVDRIDDGMVTDFIQLGVFPLFNVADSCITLGVAILLLHGLVQRSST